MLYMRGSTQREALATQREKYIPHVRLISTIQHSVSFSTVSLSCIPWAVFPHCLCVLRSSVRFVASYWPDGKIKGAYTASPFALLRTRKYMWFVGKCPENIQGS